eukprot:scaffold312665_cov27-Tisochrysis_lutea.AAC.2
MSAGGVAPEDEESSSPVAKVPSRRKLSVCEKLVMPRPPIMPSLARKYPRRKATPPDTCDR